MVRGKRACLEKRSMPGERRLGQSGLWPWGRKGGVHGKREGVGAKTVVVTGEAATRDVFSSNI